MIINIIILLFIAFVSYCVGRWSHILGGHLNAPEALNKLLTDEVYYKEVSKKALAQSKLINGNEEIQAFVKCVEDLNNASI